MINSINRFSKFWNNYGFEILFVLSLVFLIGCSIYYYFNKSKGTWNSTVNLGDFVKNGDLLNKPKKRRVITESKGEKECKRVLERYLNRPFKKIRPNFLENHVLGQGTNLEIDCYNDELKLGCEYSGRQHYEYVPFFHKNKEAFHNQKYRDELKRIKCKEAGINLIEVPYTVKIEDIEGFLKNKLLSLGYI